MKKSLTPRQAEVYGFMVSYFIANHQLPPARELCRRFGWTSDNSAVDLRRALVRKGYIQLNDTGKYRLTREIELFP